MDVDDGDSEAGASELRAPGTGRMRSDLICQHVNNDLVIEALYPRHVLDAVGGLTLAKKDKNRPVRYHGSAQ
jgi:hypothetical protein